MNQQTMFPVGCQVVSSREWLGTTINGMTYGYLPEGAKGAVIGHTEDGRAQIAFPGYGVHTFSDAGSMVVQMPEQAAELEQLRAERDDLAAKLAAAQAELDELRIEKAFREREARQKSLIAI